MLGGMLQVLVTVWIGVHPVTYVVPKLYTVMDHAACQQRADYILSRRKDKVRVSVECVPSNHQAA